MAATLGDRVTRLEVALEGLTRQISRELEVASAIHASMDRSVASLTALLEGQEKRVGALERVYWRGVGAIGVIVALLTVFAPVIRRVVGVEP